MRRGHPCHVRGSCRWSSNGTHWEWQQKCSLHHISNSYKVIHLNNGLKAWINVNVMVQFYPWFKFYYPLFQIHHHTLWYAKTKDNYKIWTKDKIEPQHQYLTNCTPILPSPNPTLTLTCFQLTVLGLGGRVGVQLVWYWYWSKDFMIFRRGYQYVQIVTSSATWSWYYFLAWRRLAVWSWKHSDLHHTWLHRETNKKLSFYYFEIQEKPLTPEVGSEYYLCYNQCYFAIRIYNQTTEPQASKCCCIHLRLYQIGLFFFTW